MMQKKPDGSNTFNGQDEQYMSIGSPTTDFRTVIIEDTENDYIENSKNVSGFAQHNRTLGSSNLVD